ncbi:sigma-70 family RNA polymerase sigma factor [Rhodobacter capsulatus]|uniref:sigma-70 family RNA polymerase sigma factor n=1 Tax=Rhodobacter capsulatus TaxID=1061 RepID=UPI0009C188D9|nr:sigma-70 family RNA polymerase sigma factor [Rhodobacter capsulatus]
MDLVAEFQDMDRAHPVIAPDRSVDAASASTRSGRHPDHAGYQPDARAVALGRTALHLAAAAGDAFACKTLIASGYDPSLPDRHGRSAAAQARSAGHFDLADALDGRIASQAEIDARRPLSFGELTGLVLDNARVLERLVKEKRLDARDSKGDTPLHIVAMQGKLRSADFLVRSGADVHAVNMAGLTPGEVARESGHMLLAGLLLSAIGAADDPLEPDRPDTADNRPIIEATNLIEPPARNEVVDFDEDALDDLSFDGEVEAADFHETCGSAETRADFTRITNDVTLRTDEAEAEIDWDIDLQSLRIEGDGIGTGRAGTEDDDADYAVSRRRALRREVKHSTWHRFSIEPERCAEIAQRIVTNAGVTDEDLDEIIGICHGRFDPVDLRLNVLREIEAAGFEHARADEDTVFEAMTDVCAEDLSEAIATTCARSSVLPGMGQRVLDMRSEQRLTGAVKQARTALLLGIVEHAHVLDIILYMAEQVICGTVDCAEVTELQINPTHPTREGQTFLNAAEALRALRNAIAAGSGSAVREAVSLVADLELKPEFLEAVVAEMRESGELSAFAETMARNLAARENAICALVEASLPLCRRHAAQRTADDEDQEDVFQASFPGLLRAASSCDPALGNNFAAYASFWLMQAVSRWRSNESRLIRFPAYFSSVAWKLARAEESIDPFLSGAPRDVELAKRLCLTPSEMRKLDRLPRFAVELSVLDDLVPEGPLKEIPEHIHDAECATIMHDCLAELDDRPAEIIRMRFGIGLENEMTLEEIGQIEGVTRERIRQIEAKGMERLRHPLRLRQLHKAFPS